MPDRNVFIRVPLCRGCKRLGVHGDGGGRDMFSCELVDVVFGRTALFPRGSFQTTLRPAGCDHWKYETMEKLREL